MCHEQRSALEEKCLTAKYSLAEAAFKTKGKEVFLFKFFLNKQKVMTLSHLLQDFKSFISIFPHKELYFF